MGGKGRWEAIKSTYALWNSDCNRQFGHGVFVVFVGHYEQGRVRGLTKIVSGLKKIHLPTSQVL